MIANYDRNSFAAVLEVAALHGFVRRTNRLMTIGEREPDAKVIDASRLGFSITVVEAFKPNIDKVTAKWPGWTYLHMNCLELSQRADLDWNSYDLVWWYHGPEHVEKHLGLNLLRYLKANARFVITSMPHGVYPQGAIYGNPYEEHVSDWYEADFGELEAAVYAETVAGNDGSSLDVFIQGRR